MEESTNIHALIRERFSQLPKELQEAITSAEIAETLRDISQKYKLHLDQGQILENETYMVLLGVEKAESYEKNIQKEVAVSEEVARNIATDVARDIFLAVRDSLKALTAEKDTADIPTTDKEGDRKPPVAPQISQEIPTAQHNKLEGVVKKTSQDIEIAPRKPRSTDPYREPIE